MLKSNSRYCLGWPLPRTMCTLKHHLSSPTPGDSSPICRFTAPSRHLRLCSSHILPTVPVNPHRTPFQLETHALPVLPRRLPRGLVRERICRTGSDVRSTTTLRSSSRMQHHLVSAYPTRVHYPAAWLHRPLHPRVRSVCDLDRCLPWSRAP